MDNQSEAIKNVYLHEDGKAVIIIDQTKLPTVTEYLTLGTAKDLYDAIFELKVRGARQSEFVRHLECMFWPERLKPGITMSF